MTELCDPAPEHLSLALHWHCFSEDFSEGCAADQRIEGFQIADFKLKDTGSFSNLHFAIMT